MEGLLMISAVDFEDIFGWGPARARTGLPTPPPASSSTQEDSNTVEANSTYVIRELRPQTQRRDARTLEYASVNG
jgi:hypothetical protein